MPKIGKYVLKSDDYNDYSLVGSSVWISVDNISVYIRRRLGDSGVYVELMPRGYEANVDGILNEASASSEDAQRYIDRKVLEEEAAREEIELAEAAREKAEDA